MTKSELIARLAKQFPDLVQADVHAAVDQMLRAMTAALAAGNRVEVRDFGSFALSARPARIGRNPRTGELVEVPPKRAVHFKPGKLLRDMANHLGTAKRIGVAKGKFVVP